MRFSVASNFVVRQRRPSHSLGAIFGGKFNAEISSGARLTKGSNFQKNSTVIITLFEKFHYF